VSRSDPFSLTFAPIADARFPAIVAAAADEHRDTADRPQFAALREVQHLLGELESPDVLERHAEAGGEYLTALWVAFRFWHAGRRIVEISRPQLTAAIAAPARASPPSVPHGACYLRLPEHWFWAQIDPAEPHEPLDGLFAVEGAQGREIALLAVLGLRPERPGFSQISLTAAPGDFVTAAASARTPPFAPTLDGGIAADLRSITTAAELLHLAALALRDADRI
jgi:hypothetical protein